jgi:hypothetical protein
MQYRPEMSILAKVYMVVFSDVLSRACTQVQLQQEQHTTQTAASSQPAAIKH